VSIQKEVTVKAYCFDTGSTPNALEDVEVQIFYRNDTDFSNLMDSGYTNVEGYTELIVPSKNEYVLVRNADDYYFDLEEAFISTDTGQVFVGHGIPFTHPALPAASVCVVYGFIRDITQEITYNPTLQVKIWSATTVHTVTGQEVMAHPRIAYVDTSTGYWEIALVPNELLVPSWNQYQFIFSWREDATNPRIYYYKKFVTIPNMDSVDFSLL